MLIYFSIGLIMMVINLYMIVRINDKQEYMTWFRSFRFWIEQILFIIVLWPIMMIGAFIAGVVLKAIEISREES